MILFIYHKSRPAFLPNGFTIPFISQPTAHPGYPPPAAGNPLYRNAAAWQCTARFYRIAFLPLEIDLAYGDFPLCQPVIQAHKIAFAVCQTDRKLGHLHFFAPLHTDQQTADSRTKQII
ncbi:hypothetical protein DW724_04520 [Butyricicoccus sp. AM27-36]|nr:hypothetical protein DW724_04520 [Butyricicoccus sp. AM27-36]